MTREVGQENIPRLKLTPTSLRDYKRMSPNSSKQIPAFKIRNHGESHNFGAQAKVFELESILGNYEPQSLGFIAKL
jgi:hypothetical protein